MNKEKVPICHKGECVRDYMYIDACCSAVQKIIECGTANTIYNVSSGWEFSNLEIFQCVCNALGGGHDSLYFEDPKESGHDGGRYALDNSRLKNLNWAYELKFKDALKNTCEWYKNNPWMLK